MKTFSFIAPNTAAESVDLASIFAQSPKTILYFYPKDNTPGCTMEWQDFTRLASEFAAKWIQIIWVSRDTAESHTQFQSKCQIQIPLISDDGTLVEQFQVMWEKNMYGKKVFWMLRSTFLLDSTGNILQEWRNVRATGHAEKVLREVK